MIKLFFHRYVEDVKVKLDEKMIPFDSRSELNDMHSIFEMNLLFSSNFNQVKYE